jgi:hypothetical protein
MISSKKDSPKIAEKVCRLENCDEKLFFSRGWTHSFPCTKTMSNSKNVLPPFTQLPCSSGYAAQRAAAFA